MIKTLIQKFVKNPEDIEKIETRRSFGNLTSFVGLLINLLLFISKIIIGLLTNSIAITADAINNLSDCFSIIIMVLSFKFSTKPADKQHPYGHSRLEYIFSSLITIFVIYIGGKLIIESFKKILYPEAITFNAYSIYILILAIIAKIWLSKFYYTIAEIINSDLLKATAVDSKSDSISTSIVLISIIVFKLTNLNIDAYIGLLGGIIIIKNGYEMITSTIDKLLGTKASDEFEDEILEFINSYRGIYGAHDLIVHDYGHGNIFVTADVEVDSKAEFTKLHDLIDIIERDLKEKKSIQASLHMDPLILDNPKLNQMREFVSQKVKKINNTWQTHDLRIAEEDRYTDLIFDIVVDFEEKASDEEIVNIVKKEFKKENPKYKLIISITRGYQRTNFE